MSRRASKYDRRMHLQSFTTTRSAAKQPVKTWTDEAGFWGRIEFAYKGEETVGGIRHSEVPQLASVSQVWIYLRYRSDVVFSPTKRIRLDSRYFEIVAWYDSSGEHRELKILCKEVQA